jgi:hypothetical protein
MRRLDFRLLLLPLALLAGCAFDSTPQAVPRPAATTPAMQACEQLTTGAVWRGSVTAGPGSTAIDAGDDFFTPTCIMAPANRTLSLVVTNRGHVPHVFTIAATNTNASLDAGATGFVSVPVGSVPLRVVCTFHQHEHMVAAVVPIG